MNPIRYSLIALIALAGLTAGLGVVLAQDAPEKKPESKGSEKGDAKENENEPTPKSEPAAQFWKIDENRRGKSEALIAFEKKENMFFSDEDLKVTVRFKTPEGLEDPTKWGDLKILSAKDNLGTNLILEDDWRNSGWNEFWEHDSEHQKGYAKVEMALKPTPRKAETIQLAGRVSFLHVGDKKDLTIENLASHKDKVVFEKGGLKIVFKGPEEWGLKFELSGKKEVLLEMKILNKEGEELNDGGTMNWDEGDKEMRTVGIEGKLPEDAKLVINYAEKVEKRTQIFNLKDIKLP